MPVKFIRPTAKLVSRAWHSVKDEWITRQEYDGPRYWAVVHNWGGDLIDDDTMKIVSRHYTNDAAKAAATKLENAARGAAVLKALGISDQEKPEVVWRNGLRKGICASPNCDCMDRFGHCAVTGRLPI
jgi:hypothetical protein